jgi:hypothetical protein
MFKKLLLTIVRAVSWDMTRPLLALVVLGASVYPLSFVAGRAPSQWLIELTLETIEIIAERRILIILGL